VPGLPYRLELQSHRVEDVQLGDQTRLDGHTLMVAKEEVLGLILQDPRIASAELLVARPGESVRIVHCLDVVEPRRKIEGPGVVFPGFLGGPETVGRGVTLRLSGVGVLTSSRFPQPFSGLLAAREAIVDMSGTTAAYSPVSKFINLVLTLAPQPELDNADYDDAVRRASLRVADHLAGAALDRDPDEVDVFDFTSVDPSLPRVAYFYQAQGQGSMADTYLYGRTIENLVPTLMHPAEIMDGALVSGVFVYACFKNPTWMHQNNPVIWALRELHGKEINFSGVILNRGHNYTQMEKERSSYWAAKLAEFMGVQGVVLSAEGGGNSAIDMMLACRYMENAGIKTSVLSYESPGSDGRDFPLFFSVPEADAIVSVGSDEENISFPPVERVIGDDRLLDDETPSAGPFNIRMYYLYSALSQVGGNQLAGRLF
jgi:sarcosine reductase